MIKLFCLCCLTAGILTAENIIVSCLKKGLHFYSDICNIVSSDEE